MSKPTILLDVDGVIANFIARACRTIVLVTGERYAPQDFKSWDLKETLSAQDMRVLDMAMKTYGWCASILNYGAAAEFVRELKGLGEVIALTAPLESEFWLNERKAWLKDIGISDVIFCSGKNKPRVAADFLIEDNLQTVNQWAENNDGDALLLDRPWNQGETHPYVTRCDDYRNVLNAIVGIE